MPTIAVLAFLAASAAIASMCVQSDDADRASHSVDDDRSTGGVSQIGLEATERVDRCIERGIRALVKPLRRGDGSMSSRYPVAVTALGGMALLGYGVQYERGQYGKDLVRTVDYLLDAKRRRDDGYFHDGNGGTPSRMHGHAYAVLFLAQITGTVSLPVKNQRISRAVVDGVRIIERSQTVDGGWGYQPKATEQDEASITVCCLQALRAAKDAGFLVDPAVIDNALHYLRACSKSDGSFRYSLKGNDKSTYELTAAAVSTLDAAGQYSGEIHRHGVDYLQAQLRNHRRPWRAATKFPYYGNLYAAQVFHRLDPATWKQWSDRVYADLMSTQQADGSWKSEQFGDAYATAVALLILEIPLAYLPIYER